MSTALWRYAGLYLGLSVALISSAPAADPCAAFTWNVSHERTLFGAAAADVSAGTAAASSPNLATDRLYQLQLKPQSQINYPTSPGKKAFNPGETYGGLVRFTVSTGGVYRVALDQSAWVDLIANDAVVQARDSQGRPGCDSPHKIVEFLLPARLPLILQLSGSRSPTVKLTVTAAPSS
jgi:hypothetical protein